jgi:thymidylate synthase
MTTKPVAPAPTEEPMSLPSLILSDRVEAGLKLEEITPEDIELSGYNSYPALKGEMAV